MNFEKRYQQLNAAQRAAVDTIEGPVLVVAGPGTGKTELLSMRVANILRQTDTLPESVLCLTFTEAGSIAMQKRLADIIGRDALKVSVYTFHAFGSEIMNYYREYFYNGATFHLADDLARHGIITDILDSLPYDNPLRSRMNGKYTAIKDIMSAISDLKRSGLTDEEFRQLLDAANETLQKIGGLIASVFEQKITKSTCDALASILPEIDAIEERTPIAGIVPLKDVLANSIRHVIEDAQAHEKVTPPITAWKKQWLTFDTNKSLVLKAQKAMPKLQALTLVYSLYLKRMEKENLIDYDDMIMQVIHAIEVNEDLRAELQEKYHYVMVDEFQDTNMAQMRILHNLLDNPVHEGAPNILVVGDDDQAIYGFQGAEVSNILNFTKTYKKAKLITLTENYRSVDKVLNSAREVITQGVDRLENRIPEITKQLTSHVTSRNEPVEIQHFPTQHAERKWIASSVRTLIDRGVKPNEIAIIARKHIDLVSLLSYLVKADIPISYERRENVLDDEAVQQLELLGTVVHAISIGEHDDADALLPKIVAHPAWNINPKVIWQISLQAHRENKYWLEIMLEYPETSRFASWLVTSAASANYLPLERMVDILLGVTSPDPNYTSPLKDYFFSQDNLDVNASDFAAHLDSLSAIRRKLREHTITMDDPKLSDFLKFIRENRETDTEITSNRHIGEDEASVQLLTAHGSKGLEFEHVFIVNATDTMWGEKARSNHSVISFPPHLRLRKTNDDYDERLRLFYVAMTRAKHGLYITYADENDSAKELLRAAFLLDSSLSTRDNHTSNGDGPVETAEQLWYAPIINIPSASKQEILAPILAKYRISATHVNNFLDVSEGGPQRFLLNTLLKFPSTPSEYANYGTAIHAALQRAHEHIKATGSHLPLEDVLHEFEKQMEGLIFTEEERARLTQQGVDALTTFLNARQNTFTPDQLAEFDFIRQDVRIGDARLTGKLDVIEINKSDKTARVIDYKTGKPIESWDKGTAYQKKMAHKYRQQLLFYKLLIEHSRDLEKFTMKEGVLQFIEPNAAGDVVELALNDISTEELDTFQKLIQVIWQHIMDLNFPDTSAYDATIDGIKQFENDLLSGKI